MLCKSLFDLLAIVLSILLWFTATDYPFGIFWPLYCLYFFDLRILITSLYHWPLYCLYFFHLQLLITPLVSFGHCIACTSLIYGFWLPLWYLVAIVLSVLLWFTASDYLFGIFWPLYCLYFFDLRLLITPLVSFGHCIACTSLIYSFWLPLWYLLAIVLSVLLWFTASDYPFGIFWSLYCLYFFDWRLLITPLVSFGQCIACISLIYGFWLPLWYLLAIVVSVRFWLMASDYLFGILWPLYCLYLFDLRLLITPLVSFGHCIACTSLIYSFWLPLWYLLAIVLPVLLWFTASDYLFDILWPLHCLYFFDLRLLIIPYGIFWPLYCLYFFDVRLLITPLVSFGHCIACIREV
jgi:hypothetical protein